MNILKKFMLSLGIAAAGGIQMTAATSSEPDFAHPRKVLADAYATLNATSGDAAAGPQRVRALLEICAASRAIDPDSIFHLIGVASELAATETSEAARSLMQLVDASLLCDAYMGRRWVYDRLETPDEPLPADITEWNGSQFRSQIESRAKAALHTAQVHSTALADYGEAVNADRLTLLYFPTVTDFVADAAVALLERIEREKEIESIVSARCDASAAGSAPYYYWSLEKLRRSGSGVAGLYEFYMAHRDDEYARMILLALSDGISYGEEAVADGGKASVPVCGRDELIGLLEQSLERFPGYWDNNSLCNALMRLRQSKVSVRYPGLVCPGKPFEIGVDASYASEAGAKVFTVTQGMLNSRRGISFAGRNAVDRLNFAGADTVASAHYFGNVTLASPGVYAVLPTLNGKIDNARYYGNHRLVVCTPYVPVVISGTDEQIVVMADFVSGSPVKGVRVSAAKTQTVADAQTSTTDNTGLARFKVAHGNGYRISAVTPDGRKLFFGDRLNIYSPWAGRERTERQFNVAVMTARPIYHPGDTLQWSMVADCSDDGMRSRKAAASLKAAVTLFDANRQPVDTVDVVTDNFGRSSGIFALPVDGLTGNYSMEVRVGDNVKGRTTVMVSDYRMPTFEITGISVLRDSPAKGDVSIAGRAVTYSGMPVADAQVSADVSEALRWRWWIASRKLGRVAATTDASGRFNVVVPDSMLSASGIHDFSASITVTSLTAETATAQTAFTNGRPYLINIGGGSYIKALSSTVLPIAVYDAKGGKADIELKWKLIEKTSGKSVASGVCRSLNPVANLDHVCGGYYRLAVTPVDPALAEAAESPDYYTLYNVALNSMPADLPLLVDVAAVETNAFGRASFQYGVGADDTWLYAALCVGKKLVEVEVQKRDKGFRHLSLDLPDGSMRGLLKIFTVRDGRVFSYNVDVTRPARKALVISGESFRDRLVPGAGEHWRLRVARADSTPVEAAMNATMYNHALDALQSISWPTSFGLAEIWPEMSESTLGSGKLNDEISADIKWLKRDFLNEPQFRYWYGYNVSRKYASSLRIRGYAGAANVAEMKNENMSAVMMSPAVTDLIEVAESAEEESMALDEGAVSVEGAVAEQFNYRDADVAEAFWKPALLTDAQGNVDIDFVLPDANTTWRFMALAWTEDMQAGSMVRDIVADKPVMVQPNLPRFLREGDRAHVLATVFNNSADFAELHTVVEIFDVATMKILGTVEQLDSVAPDASATVGIDIEAPVDAAAIGYRVRSGNGTFSDGEQALIPVESAQSDVVESVPFYLNPGDKEVRVKIPSDFSGRYTLQYCQNPSWSIVKALPGLADYEPATALAAVDALFSACTAKGIVERTPQVADALKEWSGDDLTSRLAQNDALKIAVLRSTPWVQAAQSDSERMARLALLLDGKRVRDDISSAIKVLETLANADGGLRWGKWCPESSTWVTKRALHNLGLLRMAGYMPDNTRLDAMMRKALAYVDRQLELESEKKIYPDMSYAVMRSLWRDVEPSLRGSQVIQATLQDCMKNWRAASTAGKANIAILLDIYGYKNMAVQVMKSVDEFAVASPAQGVSFPSVGSISQYAPMLIAYSKVAPASSLIDGMRQWLVVREQATLGLGAQDATQLVSAFLNSGTPWHTSDEPAVVTLKGRPLDLGDACRYGGEATVALGKEAAGATLKIAPGAHVPSYGALICSYRCNPADVKASSCDAVSVEKRIVAVSADGVAEYADTLSLGQRVRVLLTLHVNRDMEYVTLTDERAAALEPLEQTPGYVVSGGAHFYRENKDSSTQLFISYLPKGTYQISYDCTANASGTFASGLATVQSALAPALTAHSAGSVLSVR